MLAAIGQDVAPRASGSDAAAGASRHGAWLRPCSLSAAASLDALQPAGWRAGIAIGKSSATRGRRHAGARYRLGALAGAAPGLLPHLVRLICRATLARGLEVLLVRREALRRDLRHEPRNACRSDEEPRQSIREPASLSRYPVLLDAGVRNRGSRDPDALQPLHHRRRVLPLFAARSGCSDAASQSRRLFSLLYPTRRPSLGSRSAPTRSRCSWLLCHRCCCGAGSSVSRVLKPCGICSPVPASLSSLATSPCC